MIETVQDYPYWEIDQWGSLGGQSLPVQLYEGTTISFSIKSNSWGSRYSFTPSCYMNVDNELLSSNVPVRHYLALWFYGHAGYISYHRPSGLTVNFWVEEAAGGIDPFTRLLVDPLRKIGAFYHAYQDRFSNDFPKSTMFVYEGLSRIWKHDVNETYNSFYGGAVSESSIEVVSNDNPSAVKIFKSISIESSTKDWVGEVYTNEDRGEEAQQSARFLRFIEKEGVQYSEIPRQAHNTSASAANIKLVGRLPLDRDFAGEINYAKDIYNKVRNLVPYDNISDEWIAGFSQVQTGYDEEADEYILSPLPNNYWDIPLLGPLLSEFPKLSNSQVFFGKNLLSITGDGTIHSAFPYEEGPLYTGYAGGLHDLSLYKRPNYTYPGFFGSPPHNLLKSSAPLRIISYSKDGEPPTSGNPHGTPPNSIRVMLIRRQEWEMNWGMDQNGYVWNIAKVPYFDGEVMTKERDDLRMLQDMIEPDALPMKRDGVRYQPNSLVYPDTIEPFYMEDCEDAGVGYAAIPPCSQAPLLVNGEEDNWQAINFLNNNSHISRKCWSPGCDYTEEEVNMAGWVGVYVMSDERLDGENMRGPYIGVKLSLPKPSEPIELFAINVDYEKTKLDGSLG